MSEELKKALSNHTSLGKYLEYVRQEKGYTIEDIVAAISIQKHFLIALEKDDYSLLPERTYALGYLRGYAKFLEIPCVDDLVTLLDNLYDFQQPIYDASASNQVRNESHMTQQPSNQKKKSFNKLYFLVIGIIVCIGIIVVYQFYIAKGKISLDKSNPMQESKVINTLIGETVAITSVSSASGNEVVPTDKKENLLPSNETNANNNLDNGSVLEVKKENVITFKPIIYPYPKETMSRYLEINFDAPVRVTIYSKLDNKVVYLYKLFKEGETYQVPGVADLVMDISNYEAAYLIVDSNILYLKPNKFNTKLNTKALYHINLDKNSLLHKYKS